MAQNLKQLALLGSDTLPAFRLVAWMKSAGTQVLANEDTPLPVTVVAGTGEGATTVATTAYAASLILKAAAGTLVSVSGYSSKASAQFIQIHDSATLPANTAVPIVLLYIPAGTTSFAFDIPLTGMPFANGITVCNSSTGPTKTLGSADCWFAGVVI